MSQSTTSDTSDASETSDVDDMPHYNEVVIVGELVTEPVWKSLPSGSEIFSFSLTVRAPTEAATSVPCVWFDPPNRVRRWAPGASVVARGRVRRRFYRAGGATGSRTEVEVSAGELFAPRAAPRRLVRKAQATLSELALRLEPPA